MGIVVGSLVLHIIAKSCECEIFCTWNILKGTHARYFIVLLLHFFDII
jgi:hypothetical protein